MRSSIHDARNIIHTLWKKKKKNASHPLVTAVNYTAYRIERRTDHRALPFSNVDVNFPSPSSDSLINERLSPKPSRAQSLFVHASAFHGLEREIGKKRGERKKERRKEGKEKKVSRALNNFHSDKTHAHLGYESTLANGTIIKSAPRIRAHHHHHQPRCAASTWASAIDDYN